MDDNKKNDIVNNSAKTFDMISKNSSMQGASRQTRKTNSLDEKALEILVEMKNKMSSNIALNGGYELLLSKIERLEENQKHIQNELNEVKKSLFDHDEGVYARLKNYETKHSLDVKDLDLKLNSIQQNVQNNLSEFEECFKEFKETKSKLDKSSQDNELKISELSVWKNNVDSILRWVIVTCATGVSGFIGKIIFDMISK